MQYFTYNLHHHGFRLYIGYAILNLSDEEKSENSEKGSALMKIIKKATIGAVAVAMFFSMTGCGDKSEQTVSTDGSTSMESVIGFLSEAYQEKTGVKVTYNPTGSGAGIQAVQENRCDIGLSSRVLKDEESETLNGTVIAYDGIAVIVNPENSVADMSVEQIAQIYTGEIDNWQDVGGNDSPIVCIGREAASGTRDGFESVTGTESKCKYAQELTSTGDVIQTVASNPNAIGYASLASVGDSVKILSVDGIIPSEETILSGAYPVQRGFLLITPKDRDLSETAQDFYNFCTSSEADEFIRKAGAVPVEK